MKSCNWYIFRRSAFLPFYCLYRLLFPNSPELVEELINSSGVDDSLRAQQLSIEDYESLCHAYNSIVKREGIEVVEDLKNDDIVDRK